MGITESISKSISESISESMMAKQYEIEETMRSMGVERFWQSVHRNDEHGQATRNKSTRRLMVWSVTKIVEGINEFLEGAQLAGAGRRHSSIKYLKQIEPEVAAYLTAKVTLDSVALEATFTQTCLRIARLIEDELAFRALKAANVNRFDALVAREKDKDRTAYDRQRKVMMHNLKTEGIEWEAWTPKACLNLGAKLLEIMMTKTGLIARETRPVDKHNSITLVVATQHAMAWIEEENSRCEAMTPTLLPTVVPPKPWTTPFDGGYWSGRVRDLTLMKTFNRKYLEELAERDLDKVYDALNAMQTTAWCINDKVFETMQEIWRRGLTLGGIPAADDLELPLKPAYLENRVPKEDWTEEQKKEYIHWKRSATEVYAMNGRLKSMRLQLCKILSVAEMFVEYPEIYFPHQLDFRGRAYAVPMFLNPQGSDLSRGLLEFANAVPIEDESGRSWLAIHGANCWGYDKVSMEDRVRWVEEHTAEILSVAADPLGFQWWAEADKPFQFLAFCFDWAGFLEEGFGYHSSLPVQMDGSCNGLQNFSAMLRDEIGGQAVNLMPSELPADIYQQVADLVLERVRKDAAEGNELAIGWLKIGITRKTCKRPVMTLAYGAKQYGFKQQVYEDTILPTRIAMGSENFPFDTPWAPSEYLGQLIWDAVGDVVVAARAAMNWLQDAARKAASAGLPVRWTTPDKLPVVQQYDKLETTRIRLTFGGTELRPTLATGTTGKLDRAKQANGISPNWVHSMDAAHMRHTIRDSYERGIRSFSMIHDSYGTHAGNAVILAESLRWAFVDIYEEDVLARFASELERQLPEKLELEPLPSHGNLELASVMDSEFFFA